MPVSDSLPTELDRERRYDSFVIRLWTDPARVTWLRAEILHVQTGLRERGVDITADWVQQTILALLDTGAPSDCTFVSTPNDESDAGA